MRGLKFDFYDSKGRQHFLLSPLSCLSAKTGGAVNGGRSPFILPLTGSAGFAIQFVKNSILIVKIFLSNFALISPFICSTSFFEMDKPKPVVFLERDLSVV